VGWGGVFVALETIVQGSFWEKLLFFKAKSLAFT
jgi:hypothetical protein